MCVLQVVKLQHRSVVPADVQWLSGDALLCDTTFAAQGEVYQGAGGDTGRDLSGLVRLYGGAEAAEGSGQNGKAAAQAQAARAAAASEAAGGGGGSAAAGLRQRTQAKPKKDKAPPTVVGGVTIEEASSEDEDGPTGSAEGSGLAAENPYADLPTVNEVAAGALVLDTGRGVHGGAVARVLRVGAASVGWQQAASVRDAAAHWRRAKRPQRPAHESGAWSTLLACCCVGCAVPHLLNARAVQAPPQPLLNLAAAFFGSLQRAVEDATGLALVDLLPTLSWPSWAAEMPDDLSFGEQPNGTESDQASGGGGSEAEGPSDGMVALADLVGAASRCLALDT